MVGATAWKEVGPDPPWLVVDRNGVGHYIVDEDTLVLLARSAEVKPAATKQLVGRGTPTSSGFMPQHRGRVQLLSKLRWIQRVDVETQIIYVSGDAKFFCAQHAPKRVVSLGVILTEGAVSVSTSQAPTAMCSWLSWARRLGDGRRQRCAAATHRAYIVHTVCAARACM